MKLLVMVPAEWHGKFVADLSSERPWLREFQVMSIAGRALANETWPACNKQQMGLGA